MGDFFSPESVAQYQVFFNNHMVMVIAWIAVAVLLIYTQVRIMAVRVPKITPNTASMLVNREEGVFVDVRAQSLFSKAHIANSLNITANDIKEGKTSRIENSKDRPIILVGKDKLDGDCFNAARSLKKMGFTKVFTLRGGIVEWSNDNLPLSNKK